jgi:cobaltochelatase CobS
MDTIKCEICGAEGIHAMPLHLKDAHPDVSIEQYIKRFPDAPVFSEAAKLQLEKKGLSPQQAIQRPLVANHAQAANVVHMPVSPAPAALPTKQPLHQLFNLADTPAVRNSRGDPISVTVFAPSHEHASFVPPTDDGHVWNEEDLKNELMALELNMPLYLYGHKGTSKTTDLKQICARTRRPLVRVQHTINTEEAHIVGQWTVQNGQTVFELGPLPLAMLHGWAYLADEYDFALASVLSVYQPVLEGDALFIKEAPAAMRLIKPHPNFRFLATGNTNGTGDDTGLYQGTSVQNAANYDRFQVVIHKQYLPEDKETTIVVNRSGIHEREAKKLVKFANDIRREYDAGKIGDTLSTRTLVTISNIGLRRANMKLGIQLGFSNKLSKVDRATVDQVAQRLYA